MVQLNDDVRENGVLTFTITEIFIFTASTLKKFLDFLKKKIS